MRALAIFLLFTASAAFADGAVRRETTLSPNLEQAEGGAWRTVGGDGRSHAWSGLLCPMRLRQFVRTTIKTFDRFGLDVGCDYNAPTSDITLYLTRRGAAPLSAAMVEAKRELETARPAEHAQLNSGNPSAGGNLSWQVALYDSDPGVRDGIWIADLHGWTLELRATYHKEDERTALADLAAFTDLAETSAGARLSLCARALPPRRAGAPITNAHEVSEAAMMTSILEGAAQATLKQGRNSLPHPLIWCAEKPVDQNGLQMLFSRAIEPDGADANSDQVSLMTGDSTETLVVAPDGGGIGALLSSANGKAEKWSATIESKEQTLIFAYFDGRPSSDAVTDLFARILKGEAKPIGGFSAKGKDITVILPPDGK